MRLLRDLDFSQFPIYDTQNSFVGLLTENGITRWLANKVVHGGEEAVNLTEPVSNALKAQKNLDQQSNNYLFVSQDMLVGQAIRIFSSKPSLEAMLITQTGAKTEKPQGIITRYDILEAMKEER